MLRLPHFHPAAPSVCTFRIRTAEEARSALRKKRSGMPDHGIPDQIIAKYYFVRLSSAKYR